MAKRKSKPTKRKITVSKDSIKVGRKKIEKGTPMYEIIKNAAKLGNKSIKKFIETNPKAVERYAERGSDTLELESDKIEDSIDNLGGRSKVYNKGNVIEEVEVEYENYCSHYHQVIREGEILHTHSGGGHICDNERLKLNSNNEISIKLIKQSWNREELKFIFLNSGGKNHLEWISDRLIHVYDENPDFDYMLKLKSIYNWVNNL